MLTNLTTTFQVSFKIVKKNSTSKKIFLIRFQFFQSLENLPLRVMRTKNKTKSKRAHLKKSSAPLARARSPDNARTWRGQGSDDVSSSRAKLVSV